MRATLEDLTKFAFCPVFFKTGQKLPQNPHPSLSTLRKEIIYLYGRQLEVGHKIDWNEALNKWNRLWWTDRDINSATDRNQCNDALVGLKQVYDYYRKWEKIRAYPAATH